jgi:pyruvate-formate lyase
MMTVSCADASTLASAQKQPEVYDLVRLRMGGWTEFLVTMYEHHQEHHKRHPLFIPPQEDL